MLRIASPRSERRNLAIPGTVSRTGELENLSALHRKGNCSGLLTSQKRHHGKRCPVRLVIVPHRVIPPRTIRFLVRQDVLGQLRLEPLAVGRRELVEQSASVVV